MLRVWSTLKTNKDFRNHLTFSPSSEFVKKKKKVHVFSINRLSGLIWVNLRNENIKWAL